MQISKEAFFTDLTDLFKGKEVKEFETDYIVTGFNFLTIVNIIKKRWGGKLANNFFSEANRRSVRFHKFFALDFINMVDILLSDNKAPRSIKLDLQEIKNLLLQNTWLVESLREHPDRLNFSKLNDLKWKPLKFQQGFLDYYNKEVSRLNLDGALLAGAAGSGKTFVSLATTHCLEAEHVIVVCPKNAVERVWQANIVEVFKKPQTYFLSTSKDTIKDQRFIVVHYEQLDYLLREAKRWKGKKVAVVLDESHNLNDTSSLRTQLFLDFVKEVGTKDIIFASGTPIKALGSEVIPLLIAIDPLFDNHTAAIYKKVHGSKATNTNDLVNLRLSPITFKIEKIELELEDAEMVTIKQRVPNSDYFTLPIIKQDMQEFIKERAVYYKERESQDAAEFKSLLEYYEFNVKPNRTEWATYLANLEKVRSSYLNGNLYIAKDEMVACTKYERLMLSKFDSERAKRFKELKTVYKYVGLKIQGECLGRIVGRRRTQCNVEIAKVFDFKSVINSTKKKTVVFSTYIEVGKAVSERVSKLGFKPLEVFGDSTKNLASTVSKFEKDGQLNPLVATYASLSTAVPLVMADTMVMVDTPFRAYIQEQAISRIHRLGSNTRARVFTLVLDTGEVPNISSRSIDILSWSQDQVKEIMGIESPFKIGETFSTESLEGESEHCIVCRTKGSQNW